MYGLLCVTEAFKSKVTHPSQDRRRMGYRKIWFECEVNRWSNIDLTSEALIVGTADDGKKVGRAV